MIFKLKLVMRNRGYEKMGLCLVWIKIRVKVLRGGGERVVSFRR